MTLPEDAEEKLAIGMWDRSLIGFFDEPGKKLKNGRMSPYYYNDRNVLSISSQLDRSGVMGQVEQAKFRDLFIGCAAGKLLGIYNNTPYEHVLGIAQAETATGGAFAFRVGKSYLWQRVNQPDKTYGAHELIEGDYEPSDKVVLADNVITDGGAKREAVEMARTAELDPVALFVQFDREEGGAQSVEQDFGLYFDAMMTLSGAVKYLVASGRMTTGHLDRVKRYHEAVLKEPGGISMFTPPSSS